MCVCFDATGDDSSYSVYLEFNPGIKHSSKNQVPLMNQVLEVRPEAFAKSLVEAGVVGGELPQRIIKANQGRYDVGGSYTVSL